MHEDYTGPLKTLYCIMGGCYKRFQIPYTEYERRHQDHRLNTRLFYCPACWARLERERGEREADTMEN